MQQRALMGGTFNPVHLGHIELALTVLQGFGFDQIALLPCFQPVHRDLPQTDAAQRKLMIERAISDYPELTLDTTEIDRAGPSYAVDTLNQKHQSEPDVQWFWIMGADSFNSLASWKQPLRILSLCNLIVCSRADQRIRRDLFADHWLADGETFDPGRCGQIQRINHFDNPCASTSLRQALKQHDEASEALLSQCLHPAVLTFIRQNHLYE